MINYEIAFTWKTQRLLIKLAIVSNPNCDEELIELCDSFYKQYIEWYKELRIYFFREFQDAANYYSFALEQNQDEETSLTKSQCFGMLYGPTLLKRNPEFEIIKYYLNPAI